MSMYLKRVTMLLNGMTLAALTSLAAQQPAAAPAHKDTSAAGITPALIARGDSVYHGQEAGGTCFACHGPEAKGQEGLAPDLTSGKWLNGDGSYRFIERTVEEGVAKPKHAAAPMPPKGGAGLTPLDVRAVAAYVYSLSHPH
jgi:mono/diheme cytochrome c family protein